MRTYGIDLPEYPWEALAPTAPSRLNTPTEP